MRDPERIERILRKIYVIWKRSPDLRLFQLLMNAAMREGELGRKGSLPATFQFLHFEDDRLESALQLLAIEAPIVDQLAALDAFKDAIIRHDC